MKQKTKKPLEILKTLAETPAQALDKTVVSSQHAADALNKHLGISKASLYFKRLGPGLTTGAADDDPSGIATYSQAGALYGFNFLWLAPFSFPLLASVLEMCARLGLATGKGLAANIKKHYPKKILIFCTMLLLVANTFNIGADLGAMAQAVLLIWPQANFAILVTAFALISLMLQVYIPYKNYSKILKILTLSLLSYVLTAFIVEIDWRAVGTSLIIPKLNFTPDEAFMITAVLGTTISPYLFFWQTSSEVEEEKNLPKLAAKTADEPSPKQLSAMRQDVWSGMFFSNLVMFFIMAVCGATLWAQGSGSIETAAQAATALRPLAGDFAFTLFCLGILGTGFLAVPVLAGSAAYAASETFGWKQGLGKKLKSAHAFYGIIIISMCLGLLMNFIGLDPIKSLYYSAALNGIISPIILIFVVALSSNPKVMGRHSTGPFGQAIGWFTVLTMVAAAAATIVSFFI